MEPKLGRWIQGLNARVVPFEQRPDAARWPDDGKFYRIVEAFNTRDGRWDLENQSDRGCIDPWASIEWEMGKHIEGSGGATHFFLVALDKNGLRIPGKGMWWWKEPMTGSFEPLNRKDAKYDGTENIPLNGYSFVPERGESGAWSGCLFGRSDVFVGAGLPANEHTSWVVVFQEVASSGPDPDPDPDPQPSGDVVQALDRLTAQVMRIADYLTRP